MSMYSRIAFLAVWLVCCSVAVAEDKPLPEAHYRAYRGVVQRVVDGDTLEVQLYLGLGVYRVETLRLLCVNTPETSGPKAKTERPAGEKATQFVMKWCFDHATVFVYVRKDDDRDVYGRLLATVVSIEGKKSLNTELLEAKMSELYMCQSAKDLPR